MSDQEELQELMSQREFRTSLAQDLLNRLAQGEDIIEQLAKAGKVAGHHARQTRSSPLRRPW